MEEAISGKRTVPSILSSEEYLTTNFKVMKSLKEYYFFMIKSINAYEGNYNYSYKVK
jgi:hypothetical protein